MRDFKFDVQSFPKVQLGILLKMTKKSIKGFSTLFFLDKENWSWEELCLPVCVLLCILRFSDLANTFPQVGNGHGKGFSPVCTLMWFTSLYLALKGLPFLGHDCQKHACVVHSGPPTCSTVKWVTISCIELKVFAHCLCGGGASGSTHWQLISCRAGCRMYLKKAPWCGVMAAAAAWWAVMAAWW